jgi:peptide-methionine (S)-S-oxide reductase
MKATFGAGCFWHVEEAFRTLIGVQKTTVGYMGGSTANPNYKEVCTDTTGHVEVVQVTYDEKDISYDTLLNLFWAIHDPTQLDRQGFDFGTQYRSAIFYHTENQNASAQRSLKKVQPRFKRPIVTQIVKATRFYPAEEYHQKYLMKHGKKTC